MKVLLLTGPAGAGKGEVAKYLSESLNQAVYIDKFAGPLKRMASCLGLDNHHLEGEHKERPVPWLNNKTPRHIMQTLGTDWGRKCIGEDVWVDLAIETVKANATQSYDIPTLQIFDDTRFPNEISKMQENFDTFVIDIIPKYERYEPIETSKHVSETQSLYYDIGIVNDGTVEDLQNATEKVLSNWLGLEIRYQ